MKMIDDLIPARKILTVDQLNRQVKTLLEQNFNHIWVEGEISNLARPASGHLYFTLKSSSAQIRCALFRFSQQTYTNQLENGAQILASAKVSLYEGRGDYQLIVDYVEGVGDGKLRIEFEQLKAKLSKEGLFDPQHKIPLPVYPKHIGLITSSTGAAIRDIISVVRRRFPLIPVTIYPTQVQGKQSGPDLVKALAIAIKDARADVLVIGRGGGSLEDLWGFNDENLARAIFACPIPIVSAVGHEIDFTICDFVADLRAPTPSAAAELITPELAEWIARWVSLVDKAKGLVMQQLSHIKQELMHLTKRLANPASKIENNAQRLDHLEQQLKNAMRYALQKRSDKLNGLVRALDAVSPLATLARGYSITQNNQGQIIVNQNQVNPGDKLTLRLHQGELHCEVLK